ncbi:MAG: phosphate ABC transporter permease PstA [Ktedonobacterales bacterium]|nr:phosphate ABC transporter permease PstA [Ktedonobacterales bacterium]
MSTPLPFAAPQTAATTRRAVVNGVAIAFTTSASLFAIAVFLVIILYVLGQGGQYINLDFFTQLSPPPGQSGGGVGPAIQGSFVLLGLASLFGIPLGLFAGIYLAEFGRTSNFATIVRFFIDVLTGIPTIIFGLFAWVLIVVPSHSFSAYAGGVALGIIMIPIVTRTTEEILRLVPTELREAALALGVPEWRTLLQVILPSVSRGLITGLLLALTRIAGETAPLLLTAFGNSFWNDGLNHAIDALPLRIYNFAQSPFPVQVHQAYAGAFVLIILLVLTSFGVRLATGGFRQSVR